MARMPWRQRVWIDAERHHGEPCIKGTRIPVRTIIGSLADGMSSEELIEAYPPLVQDDIQAALAMLVNLGVILGGSVQSSDRSLS